MQFTDGLTRQQTMAFKMRETKKRWLDLLKGSDLDGNGTLDINEFKALMQGEANYKQIFDSLDEDGNGTLDKAEVRAFVRMKVKKAGSQVSEGIKNQPDAIHSITAANNENQARFVDTFPFVLALAIVDPGCYFVSSRANLRFEDTKNRQRDMALRMRQVKKEWLTKLKQSDLDGDGVLDFSEFLTIFKDVPNPRAMFDSMDEDGSGTLDKGEIRAFVEMKMKQEKIGKLSLAPLP